MEDADIGTAEFWTECEELLERISSTLSEIEKTGPAAEAIDSLYRDIHTIKGSAQLFGFTKLGQIAHVMETSLSPVRDQKLPLKGQLIELLFKGVTVIDNLIKTAGGEMPSQKDAPDFKENPLTVQASEPAAIEQPTAIEKPPLTNIPEERATTAVLPPPVKKVETQDDHAPDSSSTVRVPVALLDKLMTLMGEMVLVRNQVLQYSNRSDDLEFLNLSQRLDVVTSEIQGEMMKTRMQPLGNVVNKFQRLVRELAKDLGKKIDLQLSGTETELDKTLLEAVKDPLTHIIRNACDHGIEPPADRRAAGKNELAKVSLRAFHEGGQVIIEVADDGRGLKKQALLKKAVEKGLITKEKADTLGEREIFNLIFLPGFSTAEKVSNISGRGVGMDVVRSNIDKIGGLVELDSRENEGTVIRLKIPLTLAIVPAMIIACDNDQYAIPQVKLVELVRVDQSNSENKIEYLQDKPVYRLRGNLLPLINLKGVLGFPSKTSSHQLSDVTNIVVLKAERQMFGLIVDDIRDTADIVVKPLSRFLKSISVYSGATILGDGSVALILDVVGIANHMKLTGESSAHSKAHESALLTSQKSSAVNVYAGEFLLFKLNAKAKHALPMDLVNRLEEFKRVDVEYSGNQRVMRYRNTILPLIPLNEYLGYGSITGQPTSDVVSVIVTQRNSRLYGIEVDEILDVFKTEAKLDDSLADRKGLLGSFMTENEIVVVVDSLQVISEISDKLNNGDSQAASKLKKRSGRILYAEDSSVIRKHVSNVLEKAGYEVEGYENGAAAFTRFSSSKPGDFVAILSDIEMPLLNGIEFARKLRKLPQCKSLPLIALTTRVEEENIKLGLNAGFDRYLEKLNPDLLLKSLDELTVEERAA